MKERGFARLENAYLHEVAPTRRLDTIVVHEDLEFSISSPRLVHTVKTFVTETHANRYFLNKS